MLLASTLLVLLSLPCAVGSSCEKSYFETRSGQRSNVPALYTVGPATTEDCMRTCRMFADCYSFNLEWSGAGLGTCHILPGGDAEGLLGAPGWTFLWSCRGVLRPYGDHCYLVLPGLVTWQAGWDACQEAGAYMLHIMDGDQQTAALSPLQAAGTRVWLGMRRPPSMFPLPFAWQRTGLELVYTAWASPFYDEQSCVVMDPARGGEWTDTSCFAATAAAVCEM